MWVFAPGSAGGPGWGLLPSDHASDGYEDGWESTWVAGVARGRDGRNHSPLIRRCSSAANLLSWHMDILTLAAPPLCALQAWAAWIQSPLWSSRI